MHLWRQLQCNEATSSFYPSPAQDDQKASIAAEEESGQAESLVRSQDWKELQNLASTFSGAPCFEPLLLPSLVLRCLIEQG